MYYIEKYIFKQIDKIHNSQLNENKHSSTLL